jgi:hypothetical protein
LAVGVSALSRVVVRPRAGLKETTRRIDPFSTVHWCPSARVSLAIDAAHAHPATVSAASRRSFRRLGMKTFVMVGFGRVCIGSPESYHKCRPEHRSKYENGFFEWALMESKHRQSEFSIPENNW